MARSKKAFVSESIRALVKASNEHNLYRKVYLKLVIMRVRAKISFMAFE